MSITREPREPRAHPPGPDASPAPAQCPSRQPDLRCKLCLSEIEPTISSINKHFKKHHVGHSLRSSTLPLVLTGRSADVVRGYVCDVCDWKTRSNANTHDHGRRLALMLAPDNNPATWSEIGPGLMLPKLESPSMNGAFEDGSTTLAETTTPLQSPSPKNVYKDKTTKTDQLDGPVWHTAHKPADVSRPVYAVDRHLDIGLGSAPNNTISSPTSQPGLDDANLQELQALDDIMQTKTGLTSDHIHKYGRLIYESSKTGDIVFLYGWDNKSLYSRYHSPHSPFSAVKYLVLLGRPDHCWFATFVVYDQRTCLVAILDPRQRNHDGNMLLLMPFIRSWLEIEDEQDVMFMFKTIAGMNMHTSEDDSALFVLGCAESFFVDPLAGKERLLHPSGMRLWDIDINALRETMVHELAQNHALDFIDDRAKRLRAFLDADADAVQIFQRTTSPSMYAFFQNRMATAFDHSMSAYSPPDQGMAISQKVDLSIPTLNPAGVQDHPKQQNVSKSEAPWQQEHNPAQKENTRSKSQIHVMTDIGPHHPTRSASLPTTSGAMPGTLAGQKRSAPPESETQMHRRRQPPLFAIEQAADTDHSDTEISRHIQSDGPTTVTHGVRNESNGIDGASTNSPCHRPVDYEAIFQRLEKQQAKKSESTGRTPLPSAPSAARSSQLSAPHSDATSKPNSVNTAGSSLHTDMRPARRPLPEHARRQN